MYSIGIDIGSCSVKVAIINEKHQVVFNKYKLHKGKIIQTLKTFFLEIVQKVDINKIKFGSIIGSGHNLLTITCNITEINEVSAIIEGCKIICPQGKSIIELGGQNSKYITGIDNNSKLEFSMNSNCSAGTGSFLEEQISRLQLKLEDYSYYATKATKVPRIAGRCSVFAKTDITHHQQEGAKVEDILLGLAYAVVQSYQGSVINRNTRKKPYIFVGGVSYNKGIIIAFKNILKLSPSEFIVPKYAETAAAIGASIIAYKQNHRININSVLKKITQLKHNFIEKKVEYLPSLNSFGNNDSLNKHAITSTKNINQKENFYLGIDIGSTSTNAVVINAKNKVIAAEYVKTLGNPINAIKNAFNLLTTKTSHNIPIAGVGITGSGRYMVGKLVGADIIKDEITSQAKASITMHKDVDTIFEIGGQDSKYISVKNGKVVDFQMNKICAAGTGSFIEEQAKKFNIPINKFGEIALSSKTPIGLGERCTVFIETSISSNLAQGAKIEDIASGLCYSIVKNYLNRVVGQKPIGEKILLQGGIAFNQGVINAFRFLTGKKVAIPSFFSVTGAYGAAILAKEAMQDKKTNFKGFDIIEQKDEVKKVIGYKPKVNNSNIFNKNVEDIIFQMHKNEIDPNKKTVGIPRALFTYGMFPMFSKIFKTLGFNVLLSSPTDEKTIAAGQCFSQDETCYPIKLINGHVAELAQKNVDFIFFPDLHTVEHPGSKTRQNYGCAYMQLAYKIVNQAMSLDKKGIKLLAPTIAFNRGKEFMMKSFMKMAKTMGKNPKETKIAFEAGMKAALDFEQRLEKNAEEIIKKLDTNKKTFVIISKIYGVADPVLNMGIPGKLMDMGFQVIPFYCLPEGDTSFEHPNMFWPFGQHILEPAKLISKHPNMYAIFLTHHCCGPDSILSHYFAEIMDNKPYLNIEVDEHSSNVGVITRIEAFVNSLNPSIKAQSFNYYQKKISYKKLDTKTELSNFDKSKPIYIPNLYPYSMLFKQLLINLGFNAKYFPKTSKKTINEGRKHTLTNEYFSLTAFLGDAFCLAKQLKNDEKAAILFPQNEGAETDAQYSRLLKTKLDKSLYNNIEIVSPFLEDFINIEISTAKQIFKTILLGDVILMAPYKFKELLINKALSFLKKQNLTLNFVKEIANEVYLLLKQEKKKKRVLAIGEPLILYNDFMNNNTFAKLEKNDVKVFYAPLSEYLWLFWADTIINSKNNQKIDLFKFMIKEIDLIMKDFSVFSKNIETFTEIADKTVGLYAGAFGRYRETKTLSNLNQIDGIITVSSTYENTGIVLDTLHKGFANKNTPSILNLTFDGNKNENDETKLESYIYYL